MADFELDENGIIIKPSKPRIVIESYSPGIKIVCTRCSSDKTVIFFGHDFPPRLVESWRESILGRKTALSDDYGVVLKHTPKGHVTSLSNPNWICKECYEGGVIINEKLQ